MTQVSSLPSSTADVNDMYHNKRLPKGIHIVGADNDSVSKVGGMSPNDGLPWGYIFIQHMSAGAFENILKPVRSQAIISPDVLFIVPCNIRRNRTGKAS